MSFSPKNARNDRSISATRVLPLVITKSKAASAWSFQCQVSSNASICAWECSPVGDLNSTL